jgi:nitroreductase
MDAIEVMRTTGACRRFRPDPVPDAVLARIFDAARFGPQGGNRQPVRFVVVRDPALKGRLAEWYLARGRPIFESYRSGGYRVGGAEPGGEPPPMIREGLHLAEHFAEVPVLVVVCAVFSALLRTDAELDRPGVVGGASIYPSVQNLLLAARTEGLGACLTTLSCADEPRVRGLLGIPDELIVAAVVPLGYPERPLPTKLSRAPLADLVFADRYGVPLFAGTVP